MVLNLFYHKYLKDFLKKHNFNANITGLFCNYSEHLFANTKRKQRRYDVEPVFAIKYDKNFKRFRLRGLDKVEFEASLISLARNKEMGK